MSTRGAFGVRINGVDKVTYNHSDSYLSGLGASFMKEVREWALLVDREYLRKKASDLRLVKSDDIPTKEEVEKFKELGTLNLGVGTQNESDWYCLLREMQGDLTAHLKSGIMIDSASFLHDSLFCEWAYILNLDSNTVEIYRGFQSAPHKKGRYYERAKGGNDRYYGVALMAEFDLNSLPMDDSWIDVLEKMDDEERG